MSTGDVICVLLGCKQAMVLRPNGADETFRVIGPCYIHGLDDNATILGPLPSNIRVQMAKAQHGYIAVHTYLNTDTGRTCSEDPRLPPLASCSDWEKIPHVWTSDDPELCEYYRNRQTGEVMNSDPRLLPSALRKRGVALRTFDLC